jgi:undecaprenyl pyrophosphate phosphatase UppP
MVSGWTLYAVAVAPALFILGVIWAMGMYLVEETDEYIRMRLVRAMMVATGITLAIASVWGFLEQLADLVHVPAYYGFVIWCGAMGLAQLWFKVTDR